jgi:hypothetical protein
MSYSWCSSIWDFKDELFLTFSEGAAPSPKRRLRSSNRRRGKPEEDQMVSGKKPEKADTKPYSPVKAPPAKPTIRKAEAASEKVKKKKKEVPLDAATAVRLRHDHQLNWWDRYCYTSDREVKKLFKSVIVPLAKRICYKPENQPNRPAPLDEFRTLTQNLVAAMPGTVAHDWWMSEYVTEIERDTDNCRRLFAEDYSEKFKDLLELYDTLTKLQRIGTPSFYFKGVEGKEFEVVGPVVDIGTVDYFPFTPAAHVEWKDKYGPGYLVEKQLTEEMQFSYYMPACCDHIDLIHVKDGLAVDLQEHDLLRKLMREYMTGRPKTIREPEKHLRAAISYQLPIRMFWPGNTHKVYSDPRNDYKGPEKPDFHTTRVKLAAQYTALLWKKEEKYLKDNGIPIVETNKKIVWEDEIKKGFGKLKSLVAQQHAIDMGFGYKWHKLKFANKGYASIGFFNKDQYPAAPHAQQSKASNDNHDDDEGDDEQEEDRVQPANSAKSRRASQRRNNSNKKDDEEDDEDQEEDDDDET